MLSIRDLKDVKIVSGFEIESAIGKMERQITAVSLDQRAVAKPTYVTGILIAVSFAKRRLSLELQNGRVLDASFSDDFEPGLLDHPRGTVHLHGRADHDDQGALVALTAVDAILSVDESPIYIDELIIDDTNHIAVPPLRFDIAFDPKDLLYDLEGEFGITLSATARPDLERFLEDELALLWNEFVEERSSRLSPQARKLRESLRERFRNAGQGAKHGV